MASTKKMKKLKNGYLDAGMLKEKSAGVKGTSFYTPAQRKHEKRMVFKAVENAGMELMPIDLPG